MCTLFSSQPEAATPKILRTRMRCMQHELALQTGAALWPLRGRKIYSTHFPLRGQGFTIGMIQPSGLQGPIIRPDAKRESTRPVLVFKPAMILLEVSLKQESYQELGVV